MTDPFLADAPVRKTPQTSDKPLCPLCRGEKCAIRHDDFGDGWVVVACPICVDPYTGFCAEIPKKANKSAE
jgi:hypothetical protein